MRVNGLFILVFFSSVTLAQTNVAVLEFQGSGVSKIDAINITSRFSAYIFETGKVQLVERDMIERILSEQNFQITGCVAEECAVEIGQLVGVQQVIAGTVALSFGMYTLTVRMVDVESGKIVKQIIKDHTGSAQGFVQISVKEAAYEIVDAAAPRAVVVPNQSQPQPVLQNATQPQPKNNTNQEFANITSIERADPVKGSPTWNVNFDKGTNHGIKKGRYYSLLKPEYEISPITGEQVFVQNVRRGEAKITYAQATASQGIVRGEKPDEDMLLDSAKHRYNFYYKRLHVEGGIGLPAQITQPRITFQLNSEWAIGGIIGFAVVTLKEGYFDWHGSTNAYLLHAGLFVSFRIPNFRAFRTNLELAVGSSEYIDGLIYWPSLIYDIPITHWLGLSFETGVSNSPYKVYPAGGVDNHEGGWISIERMWIWHPLTINLHLAL